jgi:hypothetical protein
LAYQVTAVVGFFGGILTEQLKRAHARPGRAAEAPSALRSLLLLPADYGLFCLLFLSYGAGREVFLGVYGTLLVANVVLTLALLVKWFRELSSLGSLSDIPGSLSGEIPEAPRTPSALS